MPRSQVTRTNDFHPLGLRRIQARCGDAIKISCNSHSITGIIAIASSTGGLGERLDTFDRLNAGGKTIVLVTHGNEVAERAQRVIHMKDGVIAREVINRPAPPVLNDTPAIRA